MILKIFYTASTYAEAKRTWIWFEHLTNKKKEEVLINLTLTECENERNAWENMALSVLFPMDKIKKMSNLFLAC